MLLIQNKLVNLGDTERITYPTVNIALPQKLLHDVFTKVHYALQVLKYLFRGLQKTSTGHPETRTCMLRLPKRQTQNVLRHKQGHPSHRQNQAVGLGWERDPTAALWPFSWGSPPTSSMHLQVIPPSPTPHRSTTAP